MNVSKISGCIIILIALVGAGIALHEFSAYRGLAARIRNSSQDRDELRQKLIITEAKLARLRRAKATTTMRGDQGFYASWTGMDARQQLEAAYFEFLKNLELTPAKRELLENLMIEQQQEARDVLVAAAGQGINLRTDGRKLVDILTDAVAPINQQIEALLGSSAYDQLLNSEETLPKRSITNDLQLALSSSATPMSDDEANQLVQALAEYIEPNPAIVVYVTVDGPLFPFGRAQIADEDIMQAAGVLSDKQLQMLKTLQQGEFESDDASPTIKFVGGRRSSR